MTIGELAEAWYSTTAALKPLTRLPYRSLLDAHVLPRWRALELRRLEYGAVAGWAAEVASASSASTTRKAVGVLRSVLDLAVRDHRIPSNPAIGVTLPRLPMSDQRFLTAHELEALADAMPAERDRLLTLALGWTGIRFGEIAALRAASIDPLRRRIRVDAAVAEVRGRVIAGTPKTHAARSVALPGFLAPMIGEYLATVDREGLAFPDRNGGPIRVTNWHRRTFTPTAISVGLEPPKLRVHDLRHTAASLMIPSGAGVKVVQQQLGHRTATMTLDRYAHLFPDELDALASALDNYKDRSLADFPRTPIELVEVASGADGR
jgi:integrase